MKTCPRCQTAKSFDQFNKCSRLSDGLQVECRQCYKDRRLERLAHIQAVGAETPTVLTCSACIKEKPAAEFHKNKAMPFGRMNECKQCCKARYRILRTVKCEKQRAYAQKVGREPLNRQQRAWAANNRDKKQMYDARRRAAMFRDTPLETQLTAAEWQQIIGDHHSQCAYCDKPLRQDVHHNHPDRLTQDHVVPLSRGGQHVRSNVVPACKSCNSRKHDRMEEEGASRFDGHPLSTA